MSAFDAPRAGDVFSGVALAFEAQALAAFARLPRKPRIGTVRVVPSHGAAVSWSPREPAIAGERLSYDVVLHLPAVNPDDAMTRREAATFAAYAVHELCHVLYTDLSIFLQYGAQSPMHQHVLNALEDARIERTAIATRTIPGARSLLLPLVEFLCDRAGGEFLQECAADKMHALPFALAVLCRDYGGEASKAAAAAVGPRLAAAVAIGLQALKGADSTAALVPAADAILALFPKASPQPQPGKDSDEGEQGEQGEPGDGDADAMPGDGDADAMPGDDEAPDDDGEALAPGDAADDDADDDGGEAAQDDAQGADGEGPGEDDAHGDDGAGDSTGGEDDGADDDAGEDDADADGDDGEAGEDDAHGDDAGDGAGGGGAGSRGDDWDEAARRIDAGNLNPEPARAAEALAKEVSGDAAGTFEGEMQSYLIPVQWRKLGAWPYNARDGETFARVALARCKASPVTRARLLRAMRAPRVSWSENKLLAGRIDPKRLARVGVGDPTIFIRRGETPGTETALTLLIDASGSMGRDPMYAAVAGAYSLASIFTAMRLPCEVALFKDGARGPTIYVVKERDAPLRKSAAKFQAAAQSASGETPDTEALTAYARRMARWHEARKILLILTDGVGNETQTRHDAAIEEARRGGVQVYGVGVNMHPYAIDARYPGRGVAADLAALPEALGKVLSRAADEWGRERR